MEEHASRTCWRPVYCKLLQTNACQRCRSAMMTTHKQSSRNPTLFRKHDVSSSATSSITQCSASGSSSTSPSCTSLAYGTDYLVLWTRSLFSQRTVSSLKVFPLMLKLTGVVGWSAQPDATGFGGDTSQSVKTKMINLISAVRTLMRSSPLQGPVDCSTFDRGEYCCDCVWTPAGITVTCRGEACQRLVYDTQRSRAYSINMNEDDSNMPCYDMKDSCIDNSTQNHPELLQLQHPSTTDTYTPNTYI